MSTLADERAAARAPLPEHRELLRARAARLARVPAPERDVATFEAVVFSVGGESFALAASCVLQVAVLRELTPLPGAPVPLFGVTHWRGDILTVLDLREPLGVSTRGIADMARLLVIGGPERTFGVAVDRVTEMVAVAPTQLRPLPAAAAARASLLLGMTESGVLVVDAAALVDRYGRVRRSAGRTHEGRGG
jgi:purine-binding chemotaxis protein CheW